MGPQPLVGGDLHHSARVVLQGRGAVLDDGGLLHEIVHGKRRRVAGRAAGGQRVVGAGLVIAHGLRRPRPQEDGAGVADGAQILHGALHVHLQMLGRNDVHHLQGLIHGSAHEDEPVIVKGGAGDVGAGGIGQVHLDGRLHRVGIGVREGDEVAGRQRIVLGLGHEIDGHQPRVGRLVGHDADLRRPGDHIDAHIARDELLGRGHESVARAGDLGHRADGLGAVGQRRHGLGAADGVDLGDAGDLAGSEDGRIQRAVLGGRRHADDALHAGHLGGQGVHEHR